MQVSSYLEAFLSVYGWMMYDTLYDLLAMTWLIFLPLIKLGFDSIMDIILNGKEASYNYFKRGFIQFILLIMVLLFAVIPTISVTMTDSKLNMVCPSSRTLDEIAEQSGYNYKFDGTTKAKAPILPYLFMSIGQGINNVIFNNIPCVANARLQQSALSTVAIKDDAVASEVERYAKECVNPAKVRLALATQKNPQIIDLLVKDYADKYDMPVDQVKNFIGSPLLIDIMNGGQNMTDDMLDVHRMLWWDTIHTDEMNEVLPTLTNNNNPEASVLYSSGPVTGQESDYPDNGSNQASGPVSCANWWGDVGGDGLYNRVVSIASADYIRKATMDPYLAEECGTDKSGIISPLSFGVPGLSYGAADYVATINCVSSIQKKLGNKSTEEGIRELSYLSTTPLIYNDAGILSVDDRNTVQAGMGAAAIGGFISLFNSNSFTEAASSISSNSVAFYVQMFMYRVVLKILQPMLLMGIFCFWGIYLLVGNYRGDILIKGLVLILTITIFPGVWAIADHLNNSLYGAMTSSGTIKLGITDRLILDAASTAFYVIFPLLLLYMIAEAGSASGKGAIEPSNNQSNNIGARTGNMGGSVTGGATRGAGSLGSKGVGALKGRGKSGKK